MRAGGAVSTTVLIATSGPILDEAFDMYEISLREVSQVSLFSSILRFGGERMYSQTPLWILWLCLGSPPAPLLFSGFGTKIIFFQWDQTNSFCTCVPMHKPHFLSSDKEFRLYLGVARLKNYIRVIIQEMGKQHMAKRILICSEKCRWIGVAGFLSAVTVVCELVLKGSYLQWQ